MHSLNSIIQSCPFPCLLDLTPRLRHSHVAFLREMGWSAFDIAKRLGHTVEMVDEVYGQWNYDRQREMMDKLNETMAAEKEIKVEKPEDSKLILVRKNHFIVKKSVIY